MLQPPIPPPPPMAPPLAAVLVTNTARLVGNEPVSSSSASEGFSSGLENGDLTISTTTSSSSTTTTSSNSVGGSITNSPVGIIFPPPDMRGIIDKTAQFVAKNGQEFEFRVMSEQNTARFAFLMPMNPYRPYYEMKVKEFKTGTEGSTQPAVPQAILEMKKKEEAKKKEKEHILMLTNSAVASAADSETDEVKEPEADIYSVIPPFIAPVDIDVIKTTAQFVARNGQRFLVGLSQRERNNPQFDFLKPTHALFGYFTNLVEAYTRCLMPPCGDVAKLKAMSADFLARLPTCYSRYKWQAQEDSKKNESAKREEEERAQMQSIDWHDFAVVETIEFTPEDDKAELAAPIDFSKLSDVARPAMALEATASRQPEVTSAAALSNMIEVIKHDADDMEMDEEEEKEGDGGQKRKARQTQAGSEPTSQSPPPDTEEREEAGITAHPPPTNVPPEPDEEIPLPPDMSEVRVVRDYVRQPRKRPLDPSRLQKCPITGQLVPADQMSEHLRILLLDPKWKEEKDRLLEKAKRESAFAPMTDIETNLAAFVSKRPEVFGSLEDL